jgi:uncharacterized protein YjbI with pentapeptide repeats
MANDEHVALLKKFCAQNVLVGANLSGADITMAVLVGANLSGANLSGANITMTFLVGANLREANLREADLEGGYRS